MANRDRTTLDYVRPGSEERARLREDFDANDSNKDGFITLGEFIRFMTSLDPEMSTEECTIGFDEIDSNHDGGIQFDEFVAWWTGR